MNFRIRNLIFFSLITLFSSCFLIDKTSKEEVDTSEANLEVDDFLSYVNVLDGSELYESADDSSKVLANLPFRSRFKELPEEAKKEDWVYVEWRGKKGWIPEDEISKDPPKSGNGFVPEHLEEICVGMENSLQCYRAVEKIVLQEGVPAKRQGAKLQVLLNDDNVMEFEDNPSEDESAIFFNYIEFIEEIDLHIIQSSVYEGGSLIGVHLSGQKINLIDFPEVSPDRKRFVTAFFCPNTTYCKNGIQIYSILEKKLERELNLEFRDWTGSDPVWIDENTISFFLYENGLSEEPTRKGKLYRHKNKWKMEKEDL